jgi:hypothetical protein
MIPEISASEAQAMRSTFCRDDIFGLIATDLWSIELEPSRLLVLFDCGVADLTKYPWIRLVNCGWYEHKCVAPSFVKRATWRFVLGWPDIFPGAEADPTFLTADVLT